MSKREQIKKYVILPENKGKSSRKLGVEIFEKHPEIGSVEYIASSIRIIRKKSNTFEKTLKENDFAPKNNWEYGWLKEKNASIFVRNNKPLNIFEVTDAVKTALADVSKGSVIPNTNVLKGSGNMLIPSIFDLHLGKLCWSQETGNDYDLNIATERFKALTLDLLAKSSGYKIERIVFPVGNDFFNSDKAKPFPQTTNGTPQIDDVRWQKLFVKGVELITWAIGTLVQVAPVEVVMVYSNHDHERVFYLGEVLKAAYESAKMVIIDNTPPVRKYVEHGKVMIGLAHGHNEKPQDLPLIMAQEQPLMWSNTFYREWLLGHLHHKMKFLTAESKDYRGVKVTYLTSPSEPDSWHFEKAYSGAIKGAEGFIYNSVEGLVGTVVSNIF